jgi:hypothetical protein
MFDRYSEAELLALPRKQLQQLCKRDDVRAWRNIKANTKVTQAAATQRVVAPPPLLLHLIPPSALLLLSLER